MHLGKTDGAGTGPLGGDGTGTGPVGKDGTGVEPLGGDGTRVGPLGGDDTGTGPPGRDGIGAGPLGGDDGTEAGRLEAACVLGGAIHFVQIVEVMVLKTVDTVAVTWVI